MKAAFVLQHSSEINGNTETKLIGLYATNELAQQAMLRVKKQTWFSDNPRNFQIYEYEINKDYWVEG